jgi:polar amino acid transport system permease protein
MLNFDWLTEYGSMFLEGLWTTLQLLFTSALLGFLLAIAVAICRLSKKAVWSVPARIFSQAIRGTPLLVQIFLLYYGLGSLFADIPSIRESWLWPYLREGFWYIVASLVLSVGAYVGEVLHAGLKAVPRGEMEAAQALGMSRWLVLRRIGIPRAVQITLPTLTGETILLLKSTALASTVAVTDLLGSANYVRAQNLITYEPLLSVAIVYMLLAWLIERGFGLLERHVPVRSPH